MTQHLARQCVFCGSKSVPVEDSRQALIQPDGFLPFRTGKDGAMKAIRRALGSQGRQSRDGSARE